MNPVRHLLDDKLSSEKGEISVGEEGYKRKESTDVRGGDVDVHAGRKRDGSVRAMRREATDTECKKKSKSKARCRPAHMS